MILSFFLFCFSASWIVNLRIRIAMILNLYGIFWLFIASVCRLPNKSWRYKTLNSALWILLFGGCYHWVIFWQRESKDYLLMNISWYIYLNVYSDPKLLKLLDPVLLNSAPHLLPFVSIFLKASWIFFYNGISIV